MLVYVDDIVIASSTVDAVDCLVNSRAAAFPIKDMGKLEYFLGLETSYNSGDDWYSTKVCARSSP